MTDHNVKHLDTDLFQIMLRSDEKDCQAMGMSLLQMLNSVPTMDINNSEHVVMTVESEKSRAEIEQIVEELVKTK